jgi:hypothetical protein
MTGSSRVCEEPVKRIHDPVIIIAAESQHSFTRKTIVSAFMTSAFMMTRDASSASRSRVLMELEIPIRRRYRPPTATASPSDDTPICPGDGASQAARPTRNGRTGGAGCRVRPAARPALHQEVVTAKAEAGSGLW